MTDPTQLAPSAIPRSDIVQKGPLISAHEAVLPLVGVLRDAGVSEAEIVANTGIDLSEASDPDMRVRMSVLDWLFRRAETAYGSTIGLDLVDLYPDNHMHFVAHLAMRCDTIGEAILQWREYAKLVCDADEITFSLEDRGAKLGYRMLDPRFASRFTAEHCMSLAVHYGRLFAGERIKGNEVRFRHSDPGYRERCEAYFGCPVLFDSDEDAIVFSADIVSMRQVTADPYLASILSAQADAMRQSVEPPSVSYRVNRQLTSALARGRRAQLAEVASELAMSERSLSRALKGEGTTFRELFDTIRQELAERYLSEGLSVTQTAYFLGFNEPSALHHAFERWQGRTIREHLAEMGAPRLGAERVSS